ncbi:TetR/AcrR family transcriptional regulator [Liquorilactobacillus satsumensis]|uniref:Transcriptional regulator n=1 Tax=Liquorilactobacillus satsumensis DSM 16230 = JCM 12392 TaxID=1423801 RepID=A0A0R1V1A8_9LACO|nr:TetR/AcrR family transcriptional regulator C-terminal domain-containing protein [Liquorilactobacillus satsumensis]KRL98900.1 transcriptional regulator [Liquorilactobacillus satsumensis DSM 16230 = JCM 12392]MCC7666257.1 TetR family transcriptional regulator [Liquorilactobacillus satsumensis]MCP9313695.1 TetR/AcrR family transcriptional regulator C-terminal domain-containing protein [Liquorilactobacillus satsumensis]MCP9327917.1 TetR/AcrR family transcriptional regulator C-terminal domain-con
MVDKPLKETLSREYILQISLALIDRDGITSFTMRKLGRELHVSPMAVYRYFPNQGNLFDGLVEFIWNKSLALNELKLAANLNWQKILIELMSHFRRTLLQHPNVLPLMSTHPLVTARQFQLVGSFLTFLVEKGMKIQPTTIFLVKSLAVYTLGFVWAEAIEPENGGVIDTANLQNSKQKLPILKEFMDSLQSEQFDEEHQFLLGISAIINGWDARPFV